MDELQVIGGGLAGCEAAWQAANRGVKVKLFEMRPAKMTGAHVGGNLAELVCSNSLGSNLLDRATGLLLEEMRRLGSVLVKCADESSIPAGGALAVDRDKFSLCVMNLINNHPNIVVIRREVQTVPDGPVIIASGPLTSHALSLSISSYLGQDHLYFYDAIAPIIVGETIDMSKAFRGSRYERGATEEGDYINCPLDRVQYEHFVTELVAAERISLKDFEEDIYTGTKAGMHRYFEGCLPVEILAMRGLYTLAFGPMRPVGLTNPHSNGRPYAVIQLRQDNIAGTLYNMVGFQTNLKFSEQKRIFRMVPGLEHAEFARFGQMHRNTFIFSPALLLASLQSRKRYDLFFAGQITGVEGYVGNIATGWLAGVNAAFVMQGKDPIIFPETTMIGALCHYITNASAVDFQPMKANFGLLPKLDNAPKNKRQRAFLYSQRSLEDLIQFWGCHENIS